MTKIGEAIKRVREAPAVGATCERVEVVTILASDRDFILSTLSELREEVTRAQASADMWRERALRWT